MMASQQQELEQVPLDESPRYLPLSVGLVLLLPLLWRLPSLWDPPWVNDEGTYFAIAQSLAHGYRLYADVWENKPPLVYLVFYGVNWLFGPSLVAVRLLAAAATLATVLVTVGLARRLVEPQRALLAGLFIGLLFGVPFLEGTTANAEVFMAPLTAGAFLGAIGRRRVVVAGLLMGVAVLFKVVAGFDAAALGLVLLWSAPRSVPRYAAAVLCPPLLVAVVSAPSGALPGMLRDAVLYDFGYVGHANGGIIPWLLLTKLLVVAIGTALLWKRRFPYIWLLYSAAGALISGRFFGHYAIQAFASLTLCLALWTRRFSARRLRIMLAGLFVGGSACCAVAGWALASSGHDSILSRRLQYFANVTRFALHLEDRNLYQAQIDDHVNRNIALAARIRTMPPGSLLAWGNVPWLYVLSDRRPATPYTSAMRTPEVPGETASLRRAIRAQVPAVVVVIRPALPRLGGAATALQRHYRVAGRVSNGTIYVAAGRTFAH